MNITVTPATQIERPILRNLMELYLYDFSEFDQAEIGTYGLFEYPYLDHYWTEPHRHPFLICLDGKLAGFVLVSRYNYLTNDKTAWIIAEFFILRKHRHKGVGEYAAHLIFDHFPGAWQVGQISENLPAKAFWRKVIDRYTGGKYEEIWLDNDHWRGSVQIFQSKPGLTERT